MKVSKDFGIILRKDAIALNSIDIDLILKEFNFEKLFDEDEFLISLGPFFGSENSEECIVFLKELGLSYIDDFFVLEGYFPDWCDVFVKKSENF